MDNFTLLVRIIIHTLAVYRFSLLLHEEDGPFDVFDWLRAKSGIRHEIYAEENTHGMLETKVDIIAEGFWARLLNCSYCLSGWIAAIAAVNITCRNKLMDLIAVYGCVWGIVHWMLKRMGY